MTWEIICIVGGVGAGLLAVFPLFWIYWKCADSRPTCTWEAAAQAIGSGKGLKRVPAPKRYLKEYPGCVRLVGEEIDLLYLHQRSNSETVIVTWLAGHRGQMQCSRVGSLSAADLATDQDESRDQLMDKIRIAVEQTAPIRIAYRT